MADLGIWAVQKAWAVARVNRALTTVTYNSIAVPLVNTTTGALSASSTPTTVEVLLSQFRRVEVDGIQVIAGDQLAYIPVDTLTVTPTTRDTLTIDAQTWGVQDVVQTANGGLWKFHLRRPGGP